MTTPSASFAAALACAALASGCAFHASSDRVPDASVAVVRVEAESADLARFPTSPAIAPQTDADRGGLSGGDWLAYAGTAPAEATLRFRVPATRQKLDLWVRDFGGGWEYRLDDGPWTSSKGPRFDTHVVVREDPRYFTATWRLLGPIELAAGEHTISIRRDPAATKSVQFAVDCFELRPVDAPPPRGWWSGRSAPAEDVPAVWMAFTPGSLTREPVQLGPVNVKPAGRQGRIVRDGSRLVFEGSREPVRLWGVTASEGHLFTMRDVDMQRLARLLASRGINFVRIHGAPFNEETPGPKTDGIQRFAAAMKAEGIYVGVDWICTATDRVDAAWGLPGFKGGEGIQNLTYFSEGYRERLRARGRNLLLAPNPHTGVPLGKDPAVGFVMIIDEDSPFFWTFIPSQMPAAFREDIERQFAAWVAKQHGGIEAALAAWGPTDAKYLQGTDAPAEGRLALYPAALLGGAAWAEAQRNLARAQDQARFMVETAHRVYAEMNTWLREEIGYAGVVLASNWKTADERVLGPLEYQLYSATDATARNTYFAPVHEKKKHFPWTPGDGVVSRSHLREPREALATHPQLENYPHLLTEGGYEHPNRYRTEEPLFIAAYYALQGVDAYIPFQLEADWNTETLKWPFLTPATFGQSPAAAFIYRDGYVREGEVVFRDATMLDDLKALKGGRIDVAAGLDEIQSKNAAASGARDAEGAATTFDPLAFYVGRVTRDLRPGAAPLIAKELVTHIDPAARTVRSATGELALDWGEGVMTIDATRAQAAVGFFDRVETRDAVFTQGVEYGALALVSLDGKPLAESRALLLQVMTEEQSLGFATEAAQVVAKKGGVKSEGERILANGRAPLIVRRPSGSVRLKFADAARLRVTALDFDGRPRGTVKLAADGTLTLRDDTLFYRIER